MKTKEITKKITKKQVEKIIEKVIEKPNKKKFGLDVTFHSCEFHKASNKTVQVSNGKTGLLIEGIYDQYYHNDKYSDVVINHFTRQCESVVFPPLEDVIAQQEKNPEEYNCYRVTIPQIKASKNVIVYIVEKDGNIEFLQKSKGDLCPENYIFKLESKNISLLSGLTLDAYIYQYSKGRPIVFKFDSGTVKFKYISVPLY